MTDTWLRYVPKNLPGVMSYTSKSMTAPGSKLEMVKMYLRSKKSKKARFNSSNIGAVYEKVRAEEILRPYRLERVRKLSAVRMIQKAWKNRPRPFTTPIFVHKEYAARLQAMLPREKFYVIEDAGNKNGMPRDVLFPADLRIDGAAYYMHFRSWDSKNGALHSENWEASRMGLLTWDSANHKDFFKRLFTWINTYHTIYIYPDAFQFRWEPIDIAPDDLPAWTSETGNCVIEQVCSQFPAKAEALRKIKLDADGGCRRHHVEQISKTLKRNVNLLNGVGGIVYSIHRYNGKTRHGKEIPPIELVVHNRHCISSVPQMPKISSAVISEGVDMKTVMENVPSTSVLWLIGDNIVSESGTIFRNEHAYLEMTDVAASLEMEIKPTTMMQSTFGVKANWWKKENSIHKTFQFREQWKDSQIFPTAYCVPESEFINGSIGMDGNNWYPSFTFPSSSVHGHYLHHQLPVSGTEILVNNAPLSIVQQPGTSHCTFSSFVHPMIALYLTNSADFTGSFSVWVPHNVLAYFIEINQPFVINQSIVVVEKQTISFSYETFQNEPKGWERKLIGRLIANNTGDIILCPDPDEFSSIVNTLGPKLGRIGTYSPTKIAIPSAPVPKSDFDFDAFLDEVDGMCQNPSAAATYTASDPPKNNLPRYVEIKNDDVGRSCSYHTHSYILGYSFVGMLMEVMKYPWSSVMKIKTDALYVRPDVEPLCKFGTLPGEFKKENGGFKNYGVRSIRQPLGILPGGMNYLPASSSIGDSLIASVSAGIVSNQINVINASAGGGKTYSTMKAVSSLRCITLVHTNKLRRDLIAKGHQNVFTYQYVFLPHGKFDPDFIQVDLWKFDIIHWDEIGSVPLEILTEIMPFISSYRIIFTGHSSQINPHCGSPPWSLISAFNSLSHLFTYDFRSISYPRSQNLKKAMEHQPNERNVALLTSEIGIQSYSEFLKSWSPSDYCLCSTHAIRNLVDSDLADIHSSKFPTLPKRIKYGNKNRALSGEIESIPLSEKCPADAELAYTLTYHAFQGATVPDTTIWICVNRTTGWADNAIYVGATRVLDIHAQIRLFTMDESKIPANMNLDLDSNICRKLSKYRDADMKHSREFSLTVSQVKKIIGNTLVDHYCPHCLQTIKLTAYESRDMKQFSVNRIDNSIGHVASNVEITCLACNIWRRENKYAYVDEEIDFSEYNQ